MNTARSFLTHNWERLSLQRFGRPSALSCVVVTPRFQASAHVIFLVLSRRSARPVLVIKAARQIGGPSPSLDREAGNLRRIQAARPGGFDSVPRLLAYEDYAGTRVLLETAVAGQVMSPAVVRRRPAACADALLAWLLELHSATSEADSHADCDTIAPALTRLQRVVDEPAVTELIARAGELVAPLQQARLPRAFAHGDLSAPNILVSEDGVLGVVDWELAEPGSLPAQDLFFALCYLALARARARDTEQCVRAFRHAFFGRQAWAQSYIERFARQADLDPALLGPLFVACWTRYLAERCVRLEDAGLPPDALRSSLLQNRYFAMWSYAVRHADEFRPHDHRIVSGSYASNLSIFSAR